jgi:hypothetical protein
MGGYGSGRRYGADPKETVEDCLILSSAKLQSDGLIREGLSASGSLRWTGSWTGEEIASAGFAVDTLGRANPWLRLIYTSDRTGQETSNLIALTTTPLPWGGVRWWFLCPLIRDGRPCRRRCGKLYLPPGARYFGCRICYDLTYTTSQESRKYDRVLRDLAADFGTTPEAVRRLLDRRCR